MVSDDNEGSEARGYAAGVVGSPDGGRAGSACGINLQDGDGFSSEVAVLSEPLFLYLSCHFWKRKNFGKAAFPAQPAGRSKPRRNVAESVGPAGICGKNAGGDTLDTSRDRQLVHAPAVERREKPA